MKCDFCKFAPPVGPEGGSDDCPLFDEFGTTWKDGRAGCTLRYSQIAALDRRHDEDLDAMGRAIGFEMDIEHRPGLSIEKAVEIASHTVGLDNSRPYRRHGRLFYRPYRNYFSGFDGHLDMMCSQAYGFAVNVSDDQSPYYKLTPAGFRWLGDRLHLKIKAV